MTKRAAFDYGFNKGKEAFEINLEVIGYEKLKDLFLKEKLGEEVSEILQHYAQFADSIYTQGISDEALNAFEKGFYTGFEGRARAVFILGESGRKSFKKYDRRKNPPRYIEVPFSSLSKSLQRDVKEQVSSIYSQGVFEIYAFLPERNNKSIFQGEWYVGFQRDLIDYPYYVVKETGKLYKLLPD